MCVVVIALVVHRQRSQQRRARALEGRGGYAHRPSRVCVIGTCGFMRLALLFGIIVRESVCLSVFGGVSLLCHVVYLSLCWCLMLPLNVLFVCRL